MIEMSEKSRGCHEVRWLPYGKACVWYPQHSVLECECGGLLLCGGSAPVCRCGTDYTGLVEELVTGVIDVGCSLWHRDLSLLPEEEYATLSRYPGDTRDEDDHRDVASSGAKSNGVGRATSPT